MSYGARYGSAAGRAKQGQACTEGIMYFVMSALMIAAWILIFGLVFPGNEFMIPGVGSFYISQEFYIANVYWFNTFASMIGLGISGIFIRIHRRSLNKRLKVAKMSVSKERR